MYVGRYATVFASGFYTMNPIVMVLGASVIVIRHYSKCGVRSV
jgi:hypothetical protein